MLNIFIGLKKDLFGCFRIEEIRDNNNETGLKEGGGIEMSIYSASIYAMLALLRFCIYLPFKHMGKSFDTITCQCMWTNIFPVAVEIFVLFLIVISIVSIVAVILLSDFC